MSYLDKYHLDVKYVYSFNDEEAICPVCGNVVTKSDDYCLSCGLKKGDMIPFSEKEILSSFSLSRESHEV